MTKFQDKFASLLQVNSPYSWNKFQICCTDTYLIRFLFVCASFRVFSLNFEGDKLSPWPFFKGTIPIAVQDWRNGAAWLKPCFSPRKVWYYSSPHLGLTDSLEGENPCLHWKPGTNPENSKNRGWISSCGIYRYNFFLIKELLEHFAQKLRPWKRDSFGDFLLK